MKFPKLQNIEKQKEMVTAFAGYNHQLHCAEGEFFDAKNISTDLYPILSSRARRVESHSFTNLNGIIDKDGLVWVDGTTLYVDGVAKTLASGISLTDSKKNIQKMGAYIVIFPDKVWYNTKDDTSGYIESELNKPGATTISFATVDSNFDSIGSKIRDESYYTDHTPNDGDYMRVTKDGKTSLRIYYKALKMWSSVATTYIKITVDGIGNYFEEEDGLKITIDNSTANWDYAEKIFVNKEDDGRLSMNTYVAKKDTNYIIIPGLLKENKTFDGSTSAKSLPAEFKRKCPDMAFITECQNRLWGCSKDGHEVYCSKQGDVKNWNYFKGISLDSWAATVGSDGLFTGAITYNQNPIFFKEDRMLKITVSSTGAHSYREMTCDGVMEGSGASLVNINSILYYLAPNGVYAYDGSVPVCVSEQFGTERYKDGLGGAFGDKYYLSVKDKLSNTTLFVYNTKLRLWAKEDNLYPSFYVEHENDLFYVKSNILTSFGGSDVYNVSIVASEGLSATVTDEFKSVLGYGIFAFTYEDGSWIYNGEGVDLADYHITVSGTPIDGSLITVSSHKYEEKPIDWCAESGLIGFGIIGAKWVSKINIRMSLEVGSYIDVWIKYDDDDKWTHIYNMSGRTTKAFEVPIRPRRCDHFKYKIAGHGNAKIFSIAKEIEEGSEKL